MTGRYIAGAYRSPFTMASGSTLDLTEVSGTWDNKTDVLDLTSASVDKTTKNGKVSFSGAITVDLTGRTDLQTIARSENPYIVTWDSQPSATFTLDADMSRRYKLQPDANGIKIVRVGGAMLIVY